MQQRRLRLGDILDDYCPRERRITNHAVVAMIEDDVRLTRCTTCDAEHDYKQARVPVSRRKKAGEPASGDLLPASAPVLAHDDDDLMEPAGDLVTEPLPFAAAPETGDAAETDEDLEGEDNAAPNDDGPVHRRLIRATLPRPEGQTPERKAPDFTMRQPTGRDQRQGGQRQRGRPPGRQAGQQQPFGQSSRPGGQRPRTGGGNGNNNGNGNRSGNVAGQRGGRPFGTDRGPRQGGGQGRKRGR